MSFTSTSKPQNKNPFLKPNKNIQINMSTLSTAQKQICIKLLAQTNLNFEEDTQKNFFQAQLKIDPTKLTSQFVAVSDKQSEVPLLSPIKKEEKHQQVNVVGKQARSNHKQNHQNTSNITFNNHKPRNKPKPIIKQPPNPIYTTSKKSLSKTVKLNLLTQLEEFYPFVELYVYPKKMPFHSLIQFIQEIYDLYWNIQINKQKPRQKIPQKQFSFDHKSNHHHNQTHLHKPYNAKQPRHKSIYIQEKQSHSQPSQTQSQKQDEKRTFCKWVFDNFITTQKEKMKIQQLLVNLVQSMNHFSYKNLGIQLFYNFLSGAYNLQTLNYYLVIRALLQQIQGQKIIEKISSYGSKAGVLYKLRLNPYDKVISEQKVLQFLQICCQSTSNQSRQDQTIDKVFQQMTQHMFFDQKKKKNFINYFQMVQFLLKEFLKVQTVNTTNLELSYTQDQGSEMNDLMFQEQLHAIMGSGEGKTNDEDLELTFEVHQDEDTMKDGYNDQYYIKEDSDAGLNEYLPNYYSRELQVEPRRQSEDRGQFQRQIYAQLYKKYEAVKKSFTVSSLQKPNQDRLQSKQILDILYEAVVKGEKKKWTEYMISKKLSPQRQSQELHFIEKLQMEFGRIKNSNIVSNNFIKKMLTVPYLREAIVKESGISFNDF